MGANIDGPTGVVVEDMFDWGEDENPKDKECCSG